LNTPADAPTDRQLAGQIQAGLQARSGLPAKRFQRKLRSTRRFVDSRFRTGLHDSLFNGKWYLELLRREIDLATGGNDPSSPANRTIIAALNAALDFNGLWAEHFRQPLRELIR